jgi:hypothetical protein
MVLADPGPLLTPPSSSSPRRPLTCPTPPKLDPRMKRRTPPPKPYLPLQTRTRHRRSHRPHVPMLMRVTPPTMRSPPHQSRLTENPPNLQPSTSRSLGWRIHGSVEDTKLSTNKQHSLSRRGRIGRERPNVEADVDEGGLRLQAATNSVACVAAPQQHHCTSHPPHQKDAVHSFAPARGRGPAQAQDRCTAPHGRLRAPPVLRPRRPPPRHRSPTRQNPRQQQHGRRK